MKEVEYTRSLAVLRPDLIEQWDFEKNVGISPEKVGIGTRQLAFWKGHCGHSWEAAVKDRVRGYGCPICAGKRVVPGVNDLATVSPEIAAEWDYEKNEGLNPTLVTTRSHKEVFWRCALGHEYEATIDNRVRGRGCPFCGRKKVIDGETDLESRNPFLASEWDIEKNNGVMPNQVFANSHDKVWWKCSLCKNEWSATVYSRMQGNGCPRCAKRLQSSFPEQAIYYYIKKHYPNAVNGYTSPFERTMELDVYIPSLKIGVEYDGKHWHSGKDTLRKESEKYKICKREGITLIRVKEKSEQDSLNCDHVIFASKKQDDTIRALAEFIPMDTDIDVERDKALIYAGFISHIKKNSLASVYPESVKEWHPTKNGDLTPDMFMPRSNQRFWWVCSLGHEYQNYISHQTTGHKCPYCAHRKLLKGFNDLATTHSYLEKEWDYDVNSELKISPDSVMAGSKEKVGWICSRGHHWTATVQGRTSGLGCPVCTSRLIQEGVNDFATSHPELVCEWHPTKNKDLKPTEVAASSNKKVWWICKEGHEWQAIVEDRHKGNGCPFCSNHRVLAGFNDLGTKNPELAAQWSEKNYPLLPSMVTCGSDKKVWWKCSNNHEWQAHIKDRNRGSGCPHCTRRKKTIPL